METVVVVAYKRRSMEPRVLAAAMDLFCLFRGMHFAWKVCILPGRYAFCLEGMHFAWKVCILPGRYAFSNVWV